MTEVKPWRLTTSWQGPRIVGPDKLAKFEVLNATEAEVRQVRAVPQIMAALREWAEADAALTDACDPENRKYWGKKMLAVTQRLRESGDALSALYESLK